MEDLTLEEKNALIKEKPEYGSIVCRCEMITEGEIMDAINELASNLNFPKRWLTLQLPVIRSKPERSTIPFCLA